MSSKADFFLKKTLGNDFFESLTKFELWKPGTRTTIDHEEIKTALMIVPRTVMALLIRELTPMQIGETKEFNLAISANATALVRLTKHERDVYSGDIEEDNKKVVDFKYRSIPGIGLVIMSAFELYDTERLVENNAAEQKGPEDHERKLQHLIDERLALHDLISKVVEKKLMEKDAIKQLIMSKLTEALSAGQAHQEPAMHIEIQKQEEVVAESKPKKESPLKGFLAEREKKKKPKAIEFVMEMAKNEQVHCPDCGKNIFDGQVFSGCICLGDDRDKKIHVKKSEDGIKMRFGRGWDPENIEMLLEVLRSRRG